MYSKINSNTKKELYNQVVKTLEFLKGISIML